MSSFEVNGGGGGDGLTPSYTPFQVGRAQTNNNFIAEQQLDIPSRLNSSLN